MKKFICLLLLHTIVTCVRAQEEEGVTLDLLKAPSSPAANLLGFATSDIERHTDISSLMLSLQSASNSFSTIPSSYAVDIAPYFLFSKKTDFTVKGLNSTDFKDVFKQTVVLSLAIRNPDSSVADFKSTSTYGGIGLKFYIKRPEYDDSTKRVIEKIWELQKKLNKITDSTLREWMRSNDPEVITLQTMRAQVMAGKNNEQMLAMQDDPNSALNVIERQLSAKLAERINDATREGYRKEVMEQLKSKAAEFKGTRKGFSWDLSAGLSGEFVNKRFDASRLYNAGVWTTVGYANGNGSNFLGLLRFLHNPDKVYALDNAPNKIADISTFDAGARYVYSKEGSKFSCSFETIYRSILSSETVDPSWRLILNADYAIFKNQKLTFSFGRNFDGTTTKDGNLVAALTFLAGFGNKR